MNRIETKIIIMVTNRLAAAQDSDAKTEMIEELSENLYQRYLELVTEGLPEEEALDKAMESLGDVEELLAFLREAQEEERKTAGGAEDQTEEKSSFNADMNSIEDIVNAALSAAKGAMKSATDVAKDVAREVTAQIKEHYPEGGFSAFTGQRGKKVETTSIPAENIHSLEIRLTNGDIELACREEEEGYIEIEGDTEEIEMMLREDGVLSITQGNTASSAFLFMRGMRHSDIEVSLPKKVWENLCVSTVNGDIEVWDKPECRNLEISSSSGDVDVHGAVCDKITFSLGSGDINAKDVSGQLHAEAKSGDVDIEGTLGLCEMYTASGDVAFTGECREIIGTSTSGDVDLDLQNLPEKIKANSVSGDCNINVPQEKGFRLSWRTVSGEFSTNLRLSGAMESKHGEFIYGDGMGSEIQLSSVSGDIGIRGRE